MELIISGVSYKNSPIDVREKAAFIKRTAREGASALIQNDNIYEALILSTCNRSEIYVVSDDAAAAQACLKRFYLNRSEQLEHYLYTYTGEAALTHLYRVACGLDSMITGEDQILGQTRDALELAQECGAAGKYLSKYFREAITFAKKTKATYKLSERPTSLSATAVKTIMKMYPDYKDKRVLLIGSGKMGMLTLRYLAGEGFGHVAMTNRTWHPGDEYEETYACLNMVPYEERYEKLQHTDIVVSATSSPHLVLRQQDMPVINHELLIIDLALPKDVDPKITTEHIRILTIDDFKHVMDDVRIERVEAAAQMIHEIDEAVTALIDWTKHSRADGLVGLFNNTARQRADEAIEILNKRYGFEGKDLDFLQKIIHSKFRELVMPAVSALKNLDCEEDIVQVEEVLSLFREVG